MKKKRDESTAGSVRQLQLSVLILIVALISILGATVAWFTITDNGHVNSMDMKITTGREMRFDLNAHGSIDQYVETLRFEQIASRISSTKGFDPRKTPIVPVTTSNCKTFTYQDGSVSSDRSGDYLTFTLHFMAEEDMIVHLTSNNEDGKKGTLITSNNSKLAKAMRVSFTADGKSYVYSPRMGNTSSNRGGVKYFGLPANSTDYNDNNAMFELKAGQDKEVIVHVWLEGTDENCTDDLKGSDYKIYLKFKGTDEHNNPVADDNSKTGKRNTTTFEEAPEEEDDSLIGRIFKAIKKIFRKHARVDE